MINQEVVKGASGIILFFVSFACNLFLADSVRNVVVSEKDRMSMR